MLDNPERKNPQGFNFVETMFKLTDEVAQVHRLNSRQDGETGQPVDLIKAGLADFVTRCLALPGLTDTQVLYGMKLFANEFVGAKDLEEFSDSALQEILSAAKNSSSSPTP